MIPYDLDHPSWSCSLPDALREISGLAVDAGGRTGWAINDEKGKLFRIDLTDGWVTQARQFAKRGDYEGLERLESSWVVARSDGRLWEVAEDETRVFESPLAKKSNVEGLAFDRARGRLLVACKGPVGSRRGHRDKRAIFAVRLPDFVWEEAPAYVVERAALRDFLAAHDECGLAPEQALDFAPSALAVDPVCGRIYVPSSRAKMLVVLEPERGGIVDAAPLRRKVHPQPEGLTFDAQGALYVSSEGRASAAVLHRFDRRPDASA